MCCLSIVIYFFLLQATVNSRDIYLIRIVKKLFTDYWQEPGDDVWAILNGAEVSGCWLWLPWPQESKLRSFCILLSREILDAAWQYYKIMFIVSSWKYRLLVFFRERMSALFQFRRNIWFFWCCVWSRWHTSCDVCRQAFESGLCPLFFMSDWRSRFPVTTRICRTLLSAGILASTTDRRQ